METLRTMEHDPCINCTAKLCPYIDCPCPQKREYDKKEQDDGYSDQTIRQTLPEM